MATSLSNHERSLRARIGAHALHAAHDSTETTANARATFLARFQDEVDPERVLSEKERKRRAQHALKAHMLRLALASAKARRQKAASDPVEEGVDASL